jgi:hypothetical protein
MQVGEILSDVILNDPDIAEDIDKRQYMDKQKAIKLQIDQLITKLKKSNNLIDVIYLTNRIKYLNGKLDVEISSSLNIESMLLELKTLKEKEFRSKQTYIQ